MMNFLLTTNPYKLDLFRNRSERLSVEVGRTAATGMYVVVHEDYEERPTSNGGRAVGFERGLLKKPDSHQQGATLVVSLIMLLVILILSTSLANVVLMDEKAARNERDKQIALQAAESALADAEQDIENASGASSRSTIFSPYSAEGFAEGCGKGSGNVYQGLCAQAEAGQKAAWLTTDIANPGSDSPSVQFGRFTGQTMPSGAGPFPSQLPRYLIELVRDTAAGQSTHPIYMYRITAVGFGIDSSTQVVLQSFYRKSSDVYRL